MVILQSSGFDCRPFQQGAKNPSKLAIGTIRGPKGHINRRILHSGSKADLLLGWRSCRDSKSTDRTNRALHFLGKSRPDLGSMVMKTCEPWFIHHRQTHTIPPRRHNCTHQTLRTTRHWGYSKSAAILTTEQISCSSSRQEAFWPWRSESHRWVCFFFWALFIGSTDHGEQSPWVASDP